MGRWTHHFDAQEYDPGVLSGDEVMGRITTPDRASEYVSEIVLIATEGALDQTIQVWLLELSTDGTGTATGNTTDKDGAGAAYPGAIAGRPSAGWTTPPTPGTKRQLLVANFSPAHRIAQLKPQGEERFEPSNSGDRRYGLQLVEPASAITLAAEIHVYGG